MDENECNHVWTTRHTTHEIPGYRGFAPDGMMLLPYPHVRYCHLCGRWEKRVRLRWQETTRESVVRTMLGRG